MGAAPPAAAAASRVTLGQAGLAAALPAACVWRLARGEGTARLAVTAIWACTALGVSGLMLEIGPGGRLPSVLRPEHWLPATLLAGLATSTLPTDWPVIRLWCRLPARSFVPWGSLLQLQVLLRLGGPAMRSALGLALGRMDGWPLAWAGLCAWLSTAALAAWSLWWVCGDHGMIQDGLGPLLRPRLIVPVALLNASGEELEFRVLLLGALLAGPAAEVKAWVLPAVAAQASYFAALHVHGGFPSGLSGGLLVFAWAVFLGLLRWSAGGMMLVFLLHAQADVVIFILVLIAERKRRRERRARKRSN